MGRTTALRILHDLSLAAWFGGTLMGAIGLNGATIEVDDHTQRTRVANAGWFRWGPVAGLSMVGHVTATGALGRFGTRKMRPTALEKIRILVTLAAAVVTAGTGAVGLQIVSAGDVPVATAVTSIDATPDDVARAQRVLRVLQWVLPTFTGAIWVVNALQQYKIR